MTPEVVRRVMVATLAVLEARLGERPFLARYLSWARNLVSQPDFIQQVLDQLEKTP